MVKLIATDMDGTLVASTKFCKMKIHVNREKSRYCVDFHIFREEKMMHYLYYIFFISYRISGKVHTKTAHKM